MSEVVNLKDVRPVANQSVIELLEQVLVDARKGEITSVAIIGIHNGKRVSTGFSEGGDYHLLNSAAARLAARLSSLPDED